MANGKSKEYEIAFKLGAELESSFKKSFGNATESIQNLEKELRDISKSNAFGKMDREVRGFSDSLKGLDQETRTFGDTLRRVAEYTGAFAIVSTAADSFTNIAGSMFDMEDSMRQIQAATGTSSEEMKEIQESVQELYDLGLGENFNDLAAAITTTKQVTKQEGDALQEITKDAIVFRDVFGEDVSESVKAVDTMMRNFGITSEESFNLLTQGAQRGLNKSDELLDTANEYASQFASLGFTANQMFDIFAAGLESGAFNLDKVGDAVKEFNIRSKDMSETSIEAYEALGLSAEEMSETFAKGGTAAQTAFRQIIQAISEVEDPVQQNMIGVGLFGTMFEDLEKDVIAAMGTARSQFDMTRDTMQEVANVKYDTTLRDFQELGREFVTDVAIPIGKDLLPTLQRLAEWTKENKDIVEFLALATPAAMVGKNVIPIVKGFGKIDDVALKAAAGAATASRSLGMFGSALAFFTNPVGLAVGAVGALTLGVMAYKKHQEEARQALINMGEDLQEASQQHAEVADRAKETNDLVWEYEQLYDIVHNNTDANKDLTYQKERLADITERLKDMYPEIITQYDIENDKLIEKTGLLKQEADAKEALAKLDMEKEVAEGIRDLSDLEDEIKSLQEQTSELEKQKDALDKAIPAFTEYQAKFERIMQMEPSDDRTAKLEELREKINEIGETVGYHFNNNAQMFTLDDVIGELRDDQIETIERFMTKIEELGEANSSYEELYKAQKEIIELDLGATLDEQAKKYQNLSDEEKRRFDSAIEDIMKLHQEMDLLPTEKRIDLEVIWKQSGQVPQDVDLSDSKLLTPNFPDPSSLQDITSGLNGYAEGGIVNHPELAWIGEGGWPEIVLPMNDSPRSQALLDTANRMMGRDGGGSPVINVSFSPHYTISGGSSSDIQRQVDESARKSYDEWKRHMEQFFREERRLNFHHG